MAIVDAATRRITIKIVYYGCALGGKTTNLETLQRLTDPKNEKGMTSIATQDDRTLFFDLMPFDLGQIGGLKVYCKVYTVPGQLHYETTRRQVLGGVDGVVLVVDSSKEKQKDNAWSADNLRFNLRTHGYDPDKIPTVLQWNKRDLPEAMSIGELELQFNPNDLPTQEAVAVTGAGVVDTFAKILEIAIAHAYAQTRQTVSSQTIQRTIEKALAPAKQAQPSLELPAKRKFDHRFDMEAYREEQAERGRFKQIIDEDTLLAQSVQANMMLAEKLEGYNLAQETGDIRRDMMQALSKLAPQLVDASKAALPDDTLTTLLSGARRSTGSLLFFKHGEAQMEERQILPAGARDVLNHEPQPAVGTVAYRLSRESAPRVLNDLALEVFYGQLPEYATHVASAVVVPLACDGLPFGGLVAYALVTEAPIDSVEEEYWKMAGTLISLSLHWRAVRSKLASLMTKSAPA